MYPSPSRRIARLSRHRLDRAAYFTALAVLQVALVIDVAPELAQRLVPRTDILTGGAWLSAAQMAAQLAAHALSLVGTAITLAFPALVLARHAQRGSLRFLGLPRLGIRFAVGGALGYMAARTLASVAAANPVIADAGVPAIAVSFATAGLALTAAGVLTAEVLRRGTAPVPVPIAPWQCAPVRIEVIDPPELATRAR